jgi:hypothetical protein
MFKSAPCPGGTLQTASVKDAIVVSKQTVSPIFATIGRGMTRQLDLVPAATKSDGTTIALVPFGSGAN